MGIWHWIFQEVSGKNLNPPKCFNVLFDFSAKMYYIYYLLSNLIIHGYKKTSYREFTDVLVCFLFLSFDEQNSRK